MKRMAVIVEGDADLLSISSLVAKAAQAFDQQIYACEPPIKAGEAKKLMRAGELERFLELGASREDADEVMLIVDLDDLCAAHISKQFGARAEEIATRYRKSIHICFIVREYECWFLCSIAKIAKELPHYGIPEDVSFPTPDAIRGAKQALRSTCKQRPYKEVRDQPIMTKHLDFPNLARMDRSFRKFVKCLTGLSYQDLDTLYPREA